MIRREIQILLVDDHAIVRQGLRVLLETEANFKVIGEAGNGLDAIKMVQQLKPDVAVLDVMMPNLNGLEVTRQLSKQFPFTKIIILSMYDDEAFVLEALGNGASGYVLKDSNSSDLIAAIKEVIAGRRYLSAPLSDRAIAAYQSFAKSGNFEKYDTLTTREREVLQLTVEGSTNAEVASRLGISVRTAETHRSNLMNKLDIHSQADLIRYAIKRGIIPMDK
ncbi:MAG: response regulator transcription factor [Acidobacteria bacterium]|nr:response regulator transcription factor [Acidobacteriota bacterium]